MKALKSRQVFLFFIAMLPVNKLFLLPSILARFANEDMWLCTLFNILIDLLTVCVLVNAARNADCDVYQTIENSLGKIPSKILFCLYAAFFLLKAVLPIIEEKTYVEITLYEVSPKRLMFLPFFIVAFYLCVKKPRAVGRTSDLAWISTITGLILIFSLSVASCDLTAVLPIGANGISKVLEGAFAGAIWHGDCVYLAFFIGRFACSKKQSFKIFSGYLLASLSVMLFMILFYGVFRSVAYRQIFALTDIAKYSTVISNIARFDYIGIIALLFSGIFSLTVPLYFATDCLYKVFKFKTRTVPALIINGLAFLIVVIFRERYYGLEKFAMTFGSAISLIFCNVLPALLPFAIRRKYEPQKN